MKSMQLVNLLGLCKALRAKKGTRLLGFDVGTRCIGLAISDPTNRIAIPHSVLNVMDTNFISHVHTIERLIKTYKISSFVIGYPLLLAGLRNKQAVKVDNFIRDLQRSGRLNDMCYYREDERLSTKVVKNAIDDLQINPGVKRRLVNKFSAVCILQRCLDRILQHDEKQQEQ